MRNYIIYFILAATVTWLVFGLLYAAVHDKGIDPPTFSRKIASKTGVLLFELTAKFDENLSEGDIAFIGGWVERSKHPALILFNPFGKNFGILKKRNFYYITIHLGVIEGDGSFRELTKDDVREWTVTCKESEFITFGSSTSSLYTRLTGKLVDDFEIRFQHSETSVDYTIKLVRKNSDG